MNFEVLSLNTGGGKRTKELIDFLQTTSQVSFICLQETFNNWKGSLRPVLFGANKHIHSEIASVLSNTHNSFFDLAGNDDGQGLTMMIKKEIEVIDHGAEFIHGNSNSMTGTTDDEKSESVGRILQWAIVNMNGFKVTVAHLHGCWSREGKGDTEARLTQAKNIITILSQKQFKISEVVLCGDFNLRLDTESLGLIEAFIGTNLVRVNKIMDTRIKEGEVNPDRVVDHFIISKGLKAENFSVLEVAVSDHRVLLADISRDLMAKSANFS